MNGFGGREASDSCRSRADDTVIALGFRPYEEPALKIAIDGRCLTDHYPGIGRYLYNLLSALAHVAEEAEISVFVGEDDGGANTRFDLAALEHLGMRLIDGTPWFKRALMQKALQNLT